jgi:hypothetical protein
MSDLALSQQRHDLAFLQPVIRAAVRAGAREPVRDLAELATGSATMHPLVTSDERLNRQARISILRGDEPRPPHKVAHHHLPVRISRTQNPQRLPEPCGVLGDELSDPRHGGPGIDPR